MNTRTLEHYTSTATSPNAPAPETAAETTIASAMASFTLGQHEELSVNPERLPNDPEHLTQKITDDIDALSNLTSSLTPQEETKLRKSIVHTSTNLAAQLVPSETRHEYGIYSDNPAQDRFHHAPTVSEVQLMGIAWDISQSDDLSPAGATRMKSILEATIGAVADDASHAFLQHVLQESIKNNQKFSTTYINESTRYLKDYDFNELIALSEAHSNKKPKATLPALHETKERLLDQLPPSHY